MINYLGVVIINESSYKELTKQWRYKMSEYSTVLESRPWQSVTKRVAIKALKNNDEAQVKRIGNHWYMKQLTPVVTTKNYNVELPEGTFSIVSSFFDGEFMDAYVDYES